MQKEVTCQPANYRGAQLTALVALRMLIGWHFLYEGISKIFNPKWSSVDYLMDSKGIFSGLFRSIVDNPTLLRTVDFLNEWGLVLIGLALIIGLFARYATIAGIVLLSLYYLTTPPFVGLQYSIPSEGSYLIVNKTLIELAALVVLLLFPTSCVVGLDWLLKKRIKR
jgi:thiosulfate dehydrogenase [quinone] large subunit